MVSSSARRLFSSTLKPDLYIIGGGVVS
jgi:D-amino-acid dehydrogenase